MAAELVNVAEAIKTELATAQVAGSFPGLTFTPERNYPDWADDLEKLDGLRVDVVPVAYDETTLEGRLYVGYVCTTHVGVRRWFERSEVDSGSDDRIDKTLIDRLILFMQELTEFFCKENGRRLAAYPQAVWQETKILSTYNRKYLCKPRMFFGLIRVSYSVTRAL